MRHRPLFPTYARPIEANVVKAANGPKRTRRRDFRGSFRGQRATPLPDRAQLLTLSKLQVGV